METRKIALSCFIGGTLCCTVALIFTPIYWWFGLIAGFAGGYISYEFREVLNAIPIAWRKAKRETKTGLLYAISAIKRFFSKPHPFLYEWIILSIPMTYFTFCFFEPTANNDSQLFTIFLFSILSLLLSFEILLTLLILAQEKGHYCVLFKTTSKKEISGWRKKGCRVVPATYTSVARGAIIGFLTILKLLAQLLWILLKYTGVGTRTGICFFCRFVWYLIKLIHSRKRVLCAIYGTTGGAISYFWLISAATSFLAQVVLIIFGGLLGAAIGVTLGWEILSKQVLHLAPVNNA